MTFEQKIEQVLEQKIRPVLSAHGGNVRLADCQDGLVTVLLSGACSGCPAADLTTRGGPVRRAAGDQPRRNGMFHAAGTAGLCPADSSGRIEAGHGSGSEILRRL